MTTKILRSTLMVVAVVLISCLLVVFWFLYEYFGQIQSLQLQQELILAARGTETGGMDYLRSLQSDDIRLTWIQEDGTVIYDTQADELLMENHADRKEIIDALASGEGHALRDSSTLTVRTIYRATRLSDGTVLRIAMRYATIPMLFLNTLIPIGMVAVVGIALSTFLARRMAKRITDPINKLDLENPLDNEFYEELSPLLVRINTQHMEIGRQLMDLQQKTDELEQITSHMAEGLMLLDADGHIVSMNSAVMALFGADSSILGKNYLALQSEFDLRNTIGDAYLNGRAECYVPKENRTYQLVANRIESAGRMIGAVVLVMDVTEAHRAEQSRREFTANVSHELKTPLQTIIGSAEILQSGLVKSGDEGRFLGHIQKEARHLLSLIEDILRLSQLDEGIDLPREDVGMLALCSDVAESLLPAAADKNIDFTVSGEPFILSGTRHLLYEMIYNLADNAIKYTPRDGTVRISLRDRLITVSDTGIGIPPEHQDRIFERFYRVDKSHSKETGGTGLGLSIVKHAAALHGGTIDLKSTPGEGTAIAIRFS